MGHTNSTANLSLPQFIGTDKPTWLGDVNGAFGAIDTAVGTIKADILAVDAKADNAVADASSAVTVANNASTTAGNASTTATTANNIANNALTVANNADGHTNQLEMKVGLLADLTTTDKTSIVKAINEVNGAIGTPRASQVSYDNTGSGLTATNVQDAIDEVAQGGGGGSLALKASVTGDGTKTIATLLAELETSAGAFQTLGAVIEYGGAYFTAVNSHEFVGSAIASSFALIVNFDITAHTKGTITINVGGATTYADQSSTVVTSGTDIKLYAFA